MSERTTINDTKHTIHGHIQTVHSKHRARVNRHGTPFWFTIFFSRNDT